jgi:hypothetical protein
MTTDRWWDIVRMRFHSQLKRQRVESELDREMRYHLERRVGENIAAGMNAQEAREAASRAERAALNRKFRRQVRTQEYDGPF